MNREGFYHSTALEDYSCGNKVFSLNSEKRIKFPTLWLGHLFNSRPILSEYFLVEGLFLNAFEIFKKRKIFNQIKTGKSIHHILPVSSKTLISLDSGGFLFQKQSNIKLPYSEFITIINNADPDLVFSLDHPLDPNLNSNENSKRIQRTLYNLKKLVSNIQKIKVIPILHGYTPYQLEVCAKGIHKICGENIDLIACGSLVPLMRTAGQIRPGYLKKWNTNSRRIMALRILKYAKNLFPESKMHVFGIGGTNIMHLMYLIADSVDSIGWRWSAAGGMIRILEVGERYISGRKQSVRWNPNLNSEDWEKLSQCRCPICLKNQESLKTSFEARAIHNAYVYQEETKIARDRIQNGSYFNYLKKRMQKNNSIKILLREFEN